jgi:tetratricopeptide (TPR) repeat protein
MHAFPLAAGLRLAGHYRERLAQAARRLAAGDDADRQASLTALRLDWPQIEPWQRWAAVGAEPERLALCVDFASGHLQALAALLPPAGQLQWTLQAVAAARALALAEVERQLLYQAGLLHKDLEQVDALLDLALQLGRQAEAAGDALALGRARLLQAQVAEMRERRDEALVHYAASQTVLEAMGPSVELVEIWGGLTRQAFYAGEHAQALSNALRQLEVAQALGVAERIGAAHLSVTGSANFVGERALSLHHAEQALAVGERCGSLRLIAHAHVALGHACRRSGRLAEAVAHYRQAIAAPPSALPPSNLANAYQGLAEAHEAQGDCDQALATFERVLTLAQALPAVANFRACEALRAIVRLRLQGGHLLQARSALLTYAQAALQLHAPPHLCDVLLGAARWALAADDAPLATLCAGALHRHADAVRADSRVDLAEVLHALAAAQALPAGEPAVDAGLAETVRQAAQRLDRFTPAA